MSDVSVSRRAIALALFLAAAPIALHAQDDRTVRGSVTTSDGLPVANATVYLVDSADTGPGVIAASTGVDGRFRFSQPVRPSSMVLVRRLGFRDQRVLIGAETRRRTTELAAIAVQGSVAPTTSVVVSDTGAYVGPNAPFFRHLAQGRGRYVTPAQIAKNQPSRTSQAIRMLPGIVLVPMASGGYAVRAAARSCYVSMWLDNAPFGARAFDVDNIPPNSLLGIEFYGVGTSVPIEYQSVDATGCGALMIWTRRGDLDFGTEVATVSDPQTVRFGPDVDEPAKLAQGVAYVPNYPDLARSAGIGGTVVVELVVDTLGQIERSSVGVVAIQAPELADAAVRAASRLRFTPAKAGGHAVRQLVHLVARFEPRTDPARSRSGR